MSLMSMLAFLAAPALRRAGVAEPDRLTDQEVKVLHELAAARDENIKLRIDVARLATQVIEVQLERDSWRQAAHSQQMQNQIVAQQLGRAPEMWCNCVPSRSQVWAAETQEGFSMLGLRQPKAGEL